MKIAILGAGTWGAALASLLKRNGHDVCLWSAVEAEITMLKETGEHKNLPGAKMPEGIAYETDINRAVCDADTVLFAVASEYLRASVKLSAPFIKEGAVLATATKGIEKDTLFTMSEIIEDEIAKARQEKFDTVALSGPTHAEEVAKNLPTSIVSASKNERVARMLAEAISCDYMRAYTNTDILGVEISGAFKNIIALAAGITRGMGFGDNALAMLMTRGIAEITRIGLAMNCRRRTFMGLAGIGDLIVTCTSRHSRNNKCGELIGRGLSYEEASREIGMVVEGYHALEAGIALAKKHKVEMPITEAVYEVIMKNVSPKEAMKKLMSRDLKSELG